MLGEDNDLEKLKKIVIVVLTTESQSSYFPLFIDKKLKYPLNTI